MNKKNILMIILMCSFGSFSMSQRFDVPEPLPQNMGVTLSATSSKDAALIQVQVNGMVCSFCAQGIEKTFKKEPAVSLVHVDLEALLVKLTLVPGMTLTDEIIRRIIEDAGYSVGNIQR